MGTRVIKRIVCVVAAVLVLSGCAAEPDAALTLRVMSYNIHHGEGTDGVFDLPRLAAVINAQRPDLVALQEVDRATTRASGVDQAAELARLTGLHHVYGAAMDYAGGEYGEAILARWPLVESWNHVMPKIDGSEPRALIVVGLHPPPPDADIQFFFAGTHLAHDSAGDRLDQARRIGRILSEGPHAGATVILAGDLNASPGSEPMRHLLEVAGYIDVFAEHPGATYPSGTPRTRIDWILVRPGSDHEVRVGDTAVINDAVASDHCAIVAEITITRK